MINEDWREQANCRGLDPELFFPTRGGAQSLGSCSTLALKVCAVCNVKSECLADAIARNEQWGIWGGRTINERKRQRRSARIQL